MKDIPELKKRCAFVAVMAAGVIAVIEALCAFFLLKILSARSPEYVGIDFDVIYRWANQRSSIRQKTEAELRLGWYRAPNLDNKAVNLAGKEWAWATDELGSRANPFSSPEVLISTYGDSFTFCDGVNDDQTWQFFLSERTGSRVLNFGHGGYGTDQALLKAIYLAEKGVDQSPIRILGIWSENINRLMSRNRFFYTLSQGDLLAFKPTFDFVQGEWVLLPNPARKMEHGSLWDAYAESRKRDFWYQRYSPKARVAFPYTIATVQYARYLWGNRPDWEAREMPRGVNLYKHPAAVRKMRHVIREFIAFSKRESFFPIVLFIPSSHDLQAAARGRSTTYAEIVRGLREETRAADEVAIVDVTEASFSVESFNVRPLWGHASVYGNRVIAKAVHRAIVERGLVPGPLE
jgi:hypothetical protein